MMPSRVLMANTKTDSIDHTCQGGTEKLSGLDQQYFKHLKSSFEEKAVNKEANGKMPASRTKTEFTRPLGTKVSTIAHMFQTLSQKKAESSVLRSPVRKDTSHINHTLFLESKVEKYPVLSSRLSPPPPTCSLSRRGSHLARFNNAKAMFEKLEETNKSNKSGLPRDIDKSAAKSSSENQNSAVKVQKPTSSIPSTMSCSNKSFKTSISYSSGGFSSNIKPSESSYAFRRAVQKSHVLQGSDMKLTHSQNHKKVTVKGTTSSIHEIISIKSADDGLTTIMPGNKNASQNEGDSKNFDVPSSDSTETTVKTLWEDSTGCSQVYQIGLANKDVPCTSVVTLKESSFHPENCSFHKSELESHIPDSAEVTSGNSRDSLLKPLPSENWLSLEPPHAGDCMEQDNESSDVQNLKQSENSCMLVVATTCSSLEPLRAEQDSILNVCSEKAVFPKTVMQIEEEKNQLSLNSVMQTGPQVRDSLPFHKVSVSALESPDKDREKDTEPSESKPSPVTCQNIDYCYGTPKNSGPSVDTTASSFGIQKNSLLSEHGTDQHISTQVHIGSKVFEDSWCITDDGSGDVSEALDILSRDGTSSLSPPLPDPPSPCYLNDGHTFSHITDDGYHSTSSPKWQEVSDVSQVFFKNHFSCDVIVQENLCQSGGESLAECHEKDIAFLEDDLTEDVSAESILADSVEAMTAKEEEKFLSPSEPHALLSDEEAREAIFLLSKTEDKIKNSSSSPTKGTSHSIKASLKHDGLEYHFFEDGHYYYERPGLSPQADDISDIENSLSSIPRRKQRIFFSTDPIKVYSTFSTEDYDRRNEDVDPISASAEYELEKRIEKMDVFPVHLNKGPEGLGLSIIGMGVGADAGVEKLGIFVKTVTSGGAADRDGRIHVNDQIIEVDGKSLVGVTQAYAAAVLRNTSGPVQFLIGREKEGTCSEIAQLISQSLAADQERTLGCQSVDEDYENKVWNRMHERFIPETSMSGEENINNLTFETEGYDSGSSDDMEMLKLKLKRTQYRTSVAEAELKKMKEKLKTVERLECDYNKWIDVAQCQLEALNHNLRSTKQELLQANKELEVMRTKYSEREKKYLKAKQIIKEFKQREKEFLQQQDYYIQLLCEKDQEYGMLVEALKDRVLLLEHTLNDTQRSAGLPITLPYSAPVQLLLHEHKASIIRPKFSKVSCTDISDSETSDADQQTTLSNSGSFDQSGDVSSVRDEVFDHVMPQTELLDISAAKAKVELVNKGSLAHRQPPSCKKQAVCCNMSDMILDKNSPNDISMQENSFQSSEELFLPRDNNNSIEGSDLVMSSACQPMTLMDEMKAAVAARQARMCRSASDECIENSMSSVCSSEELHYQLSEVASQSSASSNLLETSQSCSSVFSGVDHANLSDNYETTRNYVPEEMSGDGSKEKEESFPQNQENKVDYQNHSSSKLEKSASSLSLCAPVHEWTSEQVGQWLLSLGFEHHIPQFLDSDVTGQILLQIDSSRLKALGVLNSTERAVIKKKVKEMRSQLEKERKILEKELKARGKLLKKSSSRK